MNDIVECPSCGKRNRVPHAAAGRPTCAACHENLPWLVDVGDDRFADAVERSTVPVLVDVWAPWCGPCRMVSPVIEQLARERAGRLKVAKVNADTSPAVASLHRVSSIPMLLLYVDGREVSRSVGAKPAAQLRDWLDGALARAG